MASEENHLLNCSLFQQLESFHFIFFICPSFNATQNAMAIDVINMMKGAKNISQNSCYFTAFISFTIFKLLFNRIFLNIRHRTTMVPMPRIRYSPEKVKAFHPLAHWKLQHQLFAKYRVAPRVVDQLQPSTSLLRWR